MEIVPYSSRRREAVVRFNAKLKAAGSEWRFAARERPRDAEELPVWNESYVAVEDGEVFGGYVLKHQRFYLEGRPVQLGSLQLPVSLGQVDSRYGRVSVALLLDAIRRSPYLYSLGLGSEETQFARLLTAARWEHIAVPFYFKVLSPNRFAREIRLPPDRARTQRALRALGHARLAGSAFGLRNLGRRARSGKAGAPAGVRAREVSTFDGFADAVFDASSDSYLLIGDRSASALERTYASDEPRYLRLAVERDRDLIGWALVLDTQMRDDKYFGGMRVGTLADCLADPAGADAVVAAADRYLADRRVDLIVSNQLHAVWGDALRAAGYERGPSNFFFYFSPELAEQLAADGWEQMVHLNRGDGEGPAHL